ncbi:hypothetical protein U9M48_002314 [Paspalum notatum var. saurae]|uniref:Reverse transcriptase zinc-binding domain-containing protein n=1 Tax=Paspalum notatum var. saurae TaxID=547442 RepID=A0AAQ3PFW2_PASNO
MGRLVLVNAVLDSQLIYHMSSLLLAPGTIKQVDKRRRGFLWSGAGHATGAKCLVAWEDVQQGKESEGLGVKKLALQNDGRGTSFWHDAWCGEDDLATRFPVLLSHVKEQEVSVREVLDNGLSSTLVSRLTAQAARELSEVEAITDTLTLSDGPDVRKCFAAGDGDKLQAGVVYQALCAGDGELDAAAKFVWKNSAPPRVRFFGWLARRGRIQCRANLAVKKVVPDAGCEVCHTEEVTTPHILFHCGFTKQLWSQL